MTTARLISEVPSLESLRKVRSDILAVVARHGASNVRIYGSVARDEARPDSDVDVLVEIEKGWSLLDPSGLHSKLEDLFEFKVEIGTDVKPRLRERVHAEAVAL